MGVKGAENTVGGPGNFSRRIDILNAQQPAAVHGPRIKKAGHGCQ
jgi:hypothetical protein